jgi:hypothetical protein
MIRPRWLDAAELRVALGCMRLSTGEGRDEELGLATIAAKRLPRGVSAPSRAPR